MKKILIIFIAAVLAAGAGVFALLRPGFFSHWQRAEKNRVYVVGVVRTPPTLDAIYESFRATMKALGYEEGKNVIYKVTEVGGDAAQTKKKVAVLMNQHLDLIYPLGGLATHAVKDVADERRLALPIVFGITADPVRAKLVRDLRSSGNNVTGVVSANEIVSSKRLELFLEAAPGIKRIVFPWNDPVTTGIENFRETARILGVAVAEKRIASVSELDAFLASFPFGRGDALFRATDAIGGARGEAMARLAREKKIPFSGSSAFDAEKGALMSYGANFAKMGEQGAVLVDKILRGGKAPGDLPVELPAEFELIVNVGTARILGISVAPEFLAKATRVIQ